VKATEDPYILQMNLSRSDFLCAKAHPSYLHCNPWSESKQVTLAPEGGGFDLYDLSAHAFIGEQKSGRVALTIPQSQAHPMPPASWPRASFPEAGRYLVPA
jgi:hypothetical protein